MSGEVCKAEYVQYVGRAYAERYFGKDLDENGKVDQQDHDLALNKGKEDADCEFAKLDASGDKLLNCVDSVMKPAESGNIACAIADFHHAVAAYAGELGTPKSMLAVPKDTRPIIQRHMGGDPHDPKNGYVGDR